MLSLVFSLIGRILAWLINAYITVLFVRMILDWVSVLARNWYPRGVVAQLINIVYSITEPPLHFLLVVVSVIVLRLGVVVRILTSLDGVCVGLRTGVLIVF